MARVSHGAAVIFGGPRVRAAAVGVTRGIISIKGDVGDEGVASRRRADPAHAVVGLRIFAAFGLIGAARGNAAAGEVAGDPADRSGGGEREQFSKVGRRGISEKMGCDDYGWQRRRRGARC